jgi:hypothetical protein
VRVVARAAGIGAGLAGCAATALLAVGRPWDAVVLTLTAGVGIINALWLERTMLRVLQPGKPRALRAVVMGFGRLAFWVLLFAALFVVREHVSIWAVVGGITCFLVALGATGMRQRSENEGEE